MLFVIFYVYCNKYILILAYLHYYFFFDILTDYFSRLKDEKKNIQVEQQVRCILYTVGVNKADTFCIFYFTVGILVKIAATFIDLKKGFELINLFFLYHTIFFSLQGNKAFCDLHV